MATLSEILWSSLFYRSLGDLGNLLKISQLINSYN